MSLRRYVSLMHGLGYSAVPDIRPSTPAPLPSGKPLSRGAVRYAPGEVNDG